MLLSIRYRWVEPRTRVPTSQMPKKITGPRRLRAAASRSFRSFIIALPRSFIYGCVLGRPISSVPGRHDLAVEVVVRGDRCARATGCIAAPAASHLDMDMFAVCRIAAQAGIPLNPESGADPDLLPNANVDLTGVEVQRGQALGRVIDGDLIERATRPNHGAGTEREERLVFGRDSASDGLRLRIPTGVPAVVSQAPASRPRAVQIVFVVCCLAGTEESSRQRCANIRLARHPIARAIECSEGSSKPVGTLTAIGFRRLDAIAACGQRSVDRGESPEWCANGRLQLLSARGRQDQGWRSLVGAQFEIDPCRRRQRERVEVDPEATTESIAETVPASPALGDVNAAIIGVPCGPGTATALSVYSCGCDQGCSEREERYRAGDDRRSLDPLHHCSSFHDPPSVLHVDGERVPAGCAVLVGRCDDFVTAERERSGDSGVASTAPSSLPVPIVPSGSPSGAGSATVSPEWSAGWVAGVLAAAGATSELRTSELSWGGGSVLMCGTRESTSDGRAAAVAVRLRFSIGRMIGTGPRLCQLLFRGRPQPASAACRWGAAGSDRLARKACNRACDRCGRLCWLGARRARGASLLACGVRLGE